MFGFLRRLFKGTTARANDAAEPFPESWRTILLDQVPFYLRLPADQDRSILERDIMRFVREKTWTPVDIEIDDHKKIVIAAFACLLVNRRPDLGLYPRTREIIVRPRPFPDAFEHLAPDGSIVEPGKVLLGEAHYRGPIVLSWDAVEPLTRNHPVGHNVVIHEFAHALDYLDGLANGTPPLEGVALREWADELSDEYDGLRNKLSRGQRPRIDPYAATNEAEFFAVVTEVFFTRPTQLERNHPRLYAQLRGFYRHDPASWATRR